MVKRGLFRIKPGSNDMPWPTTFSLELTNKCNLHCITCPREYGYGKAMQPGNMDNELAFRVIDECIPYAQSMGLTGMGETLYAQNLLDVAKYIKLKKPSIITFISTNANLTDFIERITPVLPFIDTVQISTDGVGEIYENVRHGATFSLLDENLTKLKPLADKNGVAMMFNMVMNRRNYKALADLVEYAASKGVKYVNFTYINLASLTSIDTSYYKFFESEEFLAEKKRLKEAIARHPEIEVTGIDFPGNPGFKKCPFVYNHFQINWNGEVPPCCAKPFTKEYSFGNVKDSNLRAVLNSDRAKEFRSHLNTDGCPPFCSKCTFVNV